MTNYLHKSLPIIFSFFIIISFEMFAGTTGKIAGKVTDKNTGESLIGANVIITGTTMGAAADVDGNFSILNVPPGEYTLKASMVGYSPYTVIEVRVFIDITTNVNIELVAENVNLEEVVVVAEKRLIQKDVSGSVTNISSKDITELPVSSVTGVVSLQAGVESGLVIRGGASNQSLFLLDGFAMRDARNDQPVTQIALSAIQDVSLEKGGFNAEYGQVRSGILNIVTKDGSKSGYEASVTFRFSPPHDKFFDISPFDPNSFWLRPYIDPAVAYVGTANGSWDTYMQNQYPQFDGWNEISRRLLMDDNPSNDLSPEGAKRLFEWQHRKRPLANQIDYNIDAGFGGPVPVVGEYLGNLRFFASFVRNREMLMIPLTRDDYVDYNGTIKLSSDLSTAMKLNLTAIYGKSYNIAVNGLEQAVLGGTNGQSGSSLLNSTTYIRTPYQIANQIGAGNFADYSSRVFLDSYYSLADVSHLGFSANLVHAPNEKLFYEASIDYFKREYVTEPTSLRNNTLNYELFPGYFVSEAPFGFSPSPDVGIGDGMFFGGHTSTARDNTKTSSVIIKFDLTDQINFNHQIKTGIEFDYSTLNLDFATYNQNFPDLNSIVKQDYFPVRGAFYAQDKIEYNGFIANIGTRLDYSYSNVEWPNITDPFNKNYFGPGGNQNNSSATISPKGQLTVSPRIGISHPITVDSKLYFNYGHFNQLASNDYLYRVARGSVGEIAVLGDPNLPFQKTISYELGYDQVFFDEYLLQLAGYYRDISGQLASTRYISTDGQVRYNAVNDNNYQDVRGFEITIRKAAGFWIRGFATYTYQVSSQGRFGTDILYEDPSQQKVFNSTIGNFAQSKPLPQPWANLVLTFSTPNDFGSDFIGKGILSEWSLTLLSEWRAGYYFTRNPNDPSVTQNVPGKDYFNIDLRLSKVIDLGALDVTFLLDINNVLNTRRFSGVGYSDADDIEAYWNSLHLPKSSAYPNIPGDDTYGDFRDPGVVFQPIEQVASINGISNPNSKAFYYETTTGKYMQFNNGSWTQVDNSRLQEVLDTKAYIDMPNMTSFNFLDPRNIYIGIKTTIHL